MNRLLHWLRQPFPASEATGRTLLTSAAAGLFIGGFLVVFQPFGAHEWESPLKVPILAGYGVVTFVLLVVNQSLLPTVLPRFFEEKNWTVGREIVGTCWNIVSIGLANYAYNGVVFGDPGGRGFWLTHLGAMLAITALIGVFPAVGLTLFKYLRYLNRYAQPPQPAPLTAAERAADRVLTVELLAENGKDRLLLPLADLLYLESADNYSEVVFEKGGLVKKELLRGSLSRFESQVPEGVVVRCHRSYLVNLHRVQRVTGNAQGYKLHLRGLPTPIPVARAYSEVVRGLREI
jgi:hypothetical protein